MGAQALPAPPDLYSFTSFTFTNAAITGQNGPTRANCLSSYNTAANTWLNNTAYFNVVTQGYQLWTVPAAGSYRVTSIGASGGSGTTGRGAGARMIGVFAFTQGQKLKILVGQQGSTGTNPCGGNKGGGGGGSFVVSEDNSTLYIAAGGGGGDSVIGLANANAVVTTTAVAGASSGGAAGTSGSGGSATNLGCVSGAAGGGGISGAGASAGDGQPGLGFANGFIGGSGGTLYGGTAAAGGFGGGGGGSSYMGGGGGGYSGGGGGGIATCSCGSVGAGGGGGSFNSGTSPSNTAAFNATTHGSVLIEKL